MEGLFHGQWKKLRVWFKTDLESISLISTCCEISILVKPFLGLQEGMKSGWFNTRAEAARWLEPQERDRLENERVQCPDTRSVFDRFMSVQIKISLDNQPLRVGEGRLPDWLRKRKEYSR